MSAATAFRTITARVSPELHDAASHLAQQRGESVNKLVENAIAREIREQEAKVLFDAYTVLGMDAAESDVDFAFEAQAEVARV